MERGNLPSKGRPIDITPNDRLIDLANNFSPRMHNQPIKVSRAYATTDVIAPSQDLTLFYG